MSKPERTEKDEKIALESFLKASKMDKGNPITLSKIANVFYDQGEMDLSIRFYKDALQIEPDNVDLRINLGKILFLINQFQFYKPLHMKS